MKKCLILTKLVALFFFIVGCNNKNRTLIGYYDLYLKNDTYPAGAYKFHEDGRCFYYKYNRSTDERYPFDFGDVIPVNTWSLYYDTLKIQGYRYKVLRTSGDTLELMALDNSKDKLLIKSKRQKDE